MRYFCTYFDHRYLNRGLALHASLQKHCPSFKLWILCLDDLCYRLLSEMRLPSVELVELSAFEKRNPELLEAKNNRTLIEYYFTCTPAWILDVLTRFPETGILTYLDADLFFFHSPDPVYEEIGDRSIAIIPHRFSPRFKFLEQYGLFNVGWITARLDEPGLACMRRWKEQCQEWCYDAFEDGKFADQKYLDEWPERYRGHIAVLEHPGANLAPWNVLNYKLTLKSGQVQVGKQPLVFYHFHKLKILKPWLFSPNLLSYGMKSFDAPLKNIYAPYLKQLLDFQKIIAPRIENERSVMPVFRPLKAASKVSRETFWGRLAVFLKGLTLKQYVFMFRARIL